MDGGGVRTDVAAVFAVGVRTAAVAVGSSPGEPAAVTPQTSDQ